LTDVTKENIGSIIAEAQASVATVQAKIEGLQKEAQESGQKLFNETATKLFEAFPFVAQVQWTQFTPYFNDGDECTFSAYAEDASLQTAADVEEESDVHENGAEFHSKCEKVIVHYDNNPNYIPHPQPQWGTPEYKAASAAGRLSRHTRREEPNPDYDPTYEEAEEAWRKFLGAFPDDVYKSLFGDHALVTLAKSGVEVGEYSHD
jgi:hypothetical protein